jgi:hypothetical protein
MSTNGLEGRVINLEATLQQFIINTEASFARLNQTIDEIERRTEVSFSQVNQTINRVEQQTEASFARVNETLSQLNQTVDRIERQSERDKKEWNKKWGDLANRLGTVVEDIVAPNIPRIAEEYFGYREIPEYFSVRSKVYYEGRTDKQREFDTLAVYRDAIILNETKETIRQSYLDDFVSFIESGDFFNYFPQYRDRKLIPIFSSLYMADSVVNYLTKHNIYAMAMGDETMQVLNFKRLNAPNE